jgi:hypothetical protein
VLEEEAQISRSAGVPRPAKKVVGSKARLHLWTKDEVNNSTTCDAISHLLHQRDRLLSALYVFQAIQTLSLTQSIIHWLVNTFHSLSTTSIAQPFVFPFYHTITDASRPSSSSFITFLLLSRLVWRLARSSSTLIQAAMMSSPCYWLCQLYRKNSRCS